MFFLFNRPFPSSKKPHFQNEAKCEAIDMKMIFNYYANISHFHNKGFALSLVLKVRFFGIPSSKKPHFQNEAKCEAIDMKMIFNYYANISHFHNKGFALSLVLKVRFFGTRKWPIVIFSSS